MKTKSEIFFLLSFAVFLFPFYPVIELDTAPDFTLADINGKQFKLSDHLGKIILIDFFAIWCTPCITEIEHLTTLYNKYPQDTVTIISISVDPEDTDSELQNFAQQHSILWTVARDTDQVSQKYGVSYIPQLSIIDTEGYKRNDHVGLTPESELISEIDLLLSGEGDEPREGEPWGIYTAVAMFAIIIIGAIVFKSTRKSSRNKHRRRR